MNTRAPIFLEDMLDINSLVRCKTKLRFTFRAVGAPKATITLTHIWSDARTMMTLLPELQYLYGNYTLQKKMSFDLY